MAGARRNPRGITRGTRSPAGASPAAQYDHPAKRTSPLWPGIFDGDDARCECVWSWLNGQRQVKTRNDACPVHFRDRPAGAP